MIVDNMTIALINVKRIALPKISKYGTPLQQCEKIQTGLPSFEPEWRAKLAMPKIRYLEASKANK